MDGRRIGFTMGLLLIFAAPMVGLSQPDTYLVQQFDNRNGLSNSAVNCVFQDSDDMLWIGTWDGLNRYDGKSFLVFNYDSYNRNDPRSIGSNVIQHITEDRNRNIWVSTMEGVSRYEKQRGIFHHYFYTRNKRSQVREQEFEVTVDTAGQLYARTATLGFARYDAQRDSFYACPLPGTDGHFQKMLFDRGNRLWTLSESGEIRVFEKEPNHQFEPIPVVGPDSGPYTGLFIANDKVFLATSTGRLSKVDGLNLKSSEVAQLHSGIRSMAFYDQQYYLALEGQGYRKFDLDFHQEAGDGNMRPLENVKITAWTPGSEQLLWVATDGNGLIRVAPKTIPFGHLSPSAVGATKPIRAICQVDGALWIGTKGGGIASTLAFDPTGNTPAHWQYYTTNDGLSNNAVYAIEAGGNNLIYVGTDGKGLALYDRQAKQFVNWVDLEGHEDCPEFGSVYAIAEDSDGSVWVGTSGYGLLHLRFIRIASNRLAVQFVRQYTYSNDEKGLANDIIYAVCHGSDDYLWIACRYGGLSLLNKKSGKISTFKAFTHEGSLSNNDVLALYKDSKKRFWIGTSYGLNWIPEAAITQPQPVFNHLNTSNGLPNNTIHAITEDDSGYIWVSTNKGLARVNPTDSGVAHYQEADGLQSNEFSDGAVWKDTQGYLYFGGIYGLNYFLPQHIRENVRRPNLQLSGLHFAGKPFIGGEDLVLRAGQSDPGHYAVSRTDNFFEVELKAISFLHAEKCEYAWKLEGHDKTWQYGGTNGKITYSNIPPGRYALSVKWSNGEGLWTAQQEAFQLHVKPYVWLTWPALLGYALLLATGASIFYSNRRNKLEIKHRLRLEQKLREKDEALHEEQLNFFTNIAHELQTPLTLIMGSAERFQHYDRQDTAPALKQNLLAMLYQQASRLTYLVQQLLDFRKAEAGYLQNHYAILDVSSLITQLTDLFLPLSEQQDITYERQIPDGIILPTDKDKLEKVLFNLLSNAFKHSGRREHVIIAVQWDATAALLRITVSNSGCELEQHELEGLFDQFRTGRKEDPATFTTGIGLAFTRRLVQLLEGNIRATVDQGWISFCVELPPPKDHHDAEGGMQYGGTPSFIYRNMTTATAHDTLTPTDEQNKGALVETLSGTIKKTILVVEDEPGIRYLLRDILGEHYVVYEAVDGLEAVGLIRKQVPDLIISDVMMPGMDGLTLCEKIKNTPSTCHIPVVILSAKGSVEQRTEGYEVGADAYIAKPFHSNHLKVRIKNLFEQQERLHQLFAQGGTDPVPLMGNREQQQFLNALVNVIETHLDNPELNAATLEHALALSKMQLYRKLKTLSNMTPSEFIRHIRLKHAARLLTTTPLTVAEIFYRTGFNNQSYFFREFKRQYHCAPNEYRAQHYVRV
ncbi:hybrid sensor histidine kinase/response regulator transcription factor [Parapedobacter pyrenivorans]|uniref:hybrid sensor histidine kinase/response regulator transcription factor n=1 Tax=Parapedobacter pyrenivorans TaxID=1305674 RepID=UPI00333F1062